jgi:deoxycytidylate deaminase
MLTTRDMQYFDVATALAKVSPHNKAQLGAVIVKDRVVLSATTNVHKSHPMQMRYNVFRKMQGDNHQHHLHAEMHAIIRTQNKKELRGATIYVSRVCQDREYGMARPCKACERALIDYGIKRIYYTTERGYGCEEITR